jgi:hypothetical protein
VPKRYCEVGFLAIDIKAAERELKRIAIGGKNCLFVGSPTGWQRAAVPLSAPSTWRLTPRSRPASCKPFLGQECRQDGPSDNGGYAPNVLRAAVYVVGMSSCFAEALDRSLAFVGTTNYCPVLVSAISGVC